MSEWYIQRGIATPWIVSARHILLPSELVALIVAPEDHQYRRFAAVLELEQGKRLQCGSCYSESCLVMHLAFPCGDHGVWALPLFGQRPLEPFHPAPQIYSRIPSNGSPYSSLPHNPARIVMESHGKGFSDFYREAVLLRNGNGRDIFSEYKVLFGEDFPPLE